MEFVGLLLQNVQMQVQLPQNWREYDLGALYLF